MADFLETSVDLPKTAIVYWEFGLSTNETQKQNKNYSGFIFFAIFHFDPASRTASQVV